MVVLQLEIGEANDGGTLTAEVCRRLCELTDPYAPATSMKYMGQDIRLTQHVVVFCNEPCTKLIEGLGHKEIWLLRLGENALQSPATWEFPAQPPSVRPRRGLCGNVRNPLGERPIGGTPFAGLLDWMRASLPASLPGIAGPLPPHEYAIAREAFCPGNALR